MTESGNTKLRDYNLPLKSTTSFDRKLLVHYCVRDTQLKRLRRGLEESADYEGLTCHTQQCLLPLGIGNHSQSVCETVSWSTCQCNQSRAPVPQDRFEVIGFLHSFYRALFAALSASVLKSAQVRVTKQLQIDLCNTDNQSHEYFQRASSSQVMR